MNSVRADYNTRVLEIRSFINLVKLQDFTITPDHTNIEGYKAMKAATHLLIYNLVESTATGIHELIFDAILSSCTSFDELVEPLKRTVLKNTQRQNVDKLVKKITVLSIQLMEATFDREEIFSGNVDAKKLRESLQSLGLKEVKASGRKAKSGSDYLQRIKSNRNDLAHGRRTFAEVGRDLTPNDLESELDCVIAFLDQCIKSAEDFVEGSRYRIPEVIM